MALSRENAGAGSSVDLRSIDASRDWLAIDDAELMFRGTYQRIGADLKISGGDGESLTITDYFATITPPGLKAPNGAMLFPETVKALAGPAAPGQYAQVNGQATDAVGNAPIGSVEKLSGVAFATRANGVRVELKQGDPVFQQDVVETVDGTELNILFVDDTVFTLSDSAKMVLDELIYNPGDSGNSLLFNLVQGSFVFVAGKVAPTGDMQIKTPVATMGIRGTTVLVEIRTDSGVVTFDLLADKLVNPGPEDIGKFELRNPESGEVITTIDSLDVSAIFQGLNSPPVLAALTSSQVATKQEQARTAIEIVSVRVQSEEPNGDNTETPPGDENGDGTPAPGDTPPGDGTGQTPKPQGPGIGPTQNVTDGGGPFDATGAAVPPLNDIVPPPEPPPPAPPGPVIPPPEPPPPPPSSGPANSPPVVTPINAPATDQNQGVITIDLLAGQTDPDGNTLSVQNVVINTVPVQAVAFGLAAGVISIDTGEFNGLDASEAANVTVNYEVADGNGGVTANTAAFQVSGFEDAPVVTPITAAPATESDGPVLINLLAGQSDPDTNDTLTTVVTTVTSSDARVVNSTVNNAAGTITIDMSQYADLVGNEQRTITIDYTVNDGDSAPVANTVTIVVSGENEAPTVTAQAGTTGYVENGAGVAVDPGITVADIDSATLASATAQITGNFQSGEDGLGFVANGATMGNITAGAFNAATGTLTLTSSGSTATLAQWQAALRAVTYANTSDAPDAGNRTVTFIADDGTAASAAVTRQVSVSPVNDAPVATAGGTLGYTENDAATAIDTTITVADVDDTNIEGATVQITGNYVNGEDVLAFANTANITATFNAADGTLTLTGTDTLANYQAALRAVTYQNTSDNPSTAARTVTTIVNDGTANSAGVTSTVNVTAANDAPVAVAGGTLGYTENDAATAIDATITVADADDTNIEGATVQITGNYANGEDVLGFANTANITATFNASNGTLTLTGTDTLANYQAALRAVTYQNTSDTPSVVTRTVTTIINDGTANSAGVTSTVNVTAINDTPVAVEDFITTPAPAGISYDVTLNDTDADGDALSVTAATIRTSGGISASTFGTVTVSGGVISYVPATDFAGVVAIDYTVSDGNGGAANGVLRVGVTPQAGLSTSGYTPQDLVELIIPDLGGNQVTVETETGTSNFTNAQTFANTGGPYVARFADIDGDGYLDAVVSNTSAAIFNVYLNNGSGVLGAATDISTTDNHYRIQTGDFNNDGKLDVVGTSSTGVRIFTQNSPSSFTAGTQATLSVAPNLAVGDFNSDGNLDVLVSSSSGNDVSLLLGDGAGTFSNAVSPTQIATSGTQPGGIAVGDFNNDGKLDFAVTNTLSDNVSILLGQGDGTFAAPTLLAVGDAPNEIAVGDIDNDGDLDLVVSNAGSSDVTLLSGNGAGGFTPQSSIATGNASPDSIQLVDIDFDGDLDAIVGHAALAKISLLSYSQGSTNFVATNSDIVSGLTTLFYFDVGDLDTPVGRTIIGTTASETLTGTAGADVLIGLAGADTLNGGNGLDFLIGGPGNDVLNGGGAIANGNDGLVDYRSEEALHDGTQAVTVTFTGLGVGTATDTLGDTDTFSNIYAFHGSSGDDTFDASVLTGDYGLFARGMEGADTFKGSDAYDRIAYDRDRSYGGNAGIQANLSITVLSLFTTYTQIVDGFGDTDLVEVYSGAGTKINSFRGTMFADTFTGDDFNNSFQPLGGIDSIDGGLGNDEVDFRAGPANGATNGVTVDLSLGSNQVTDDGFGNTETLTSIERIRGNEFADNITGDANQNRLYGYGGDDTIAGGNAYDTISGGRGDDALSSGSNSWDDNAAFLDYLHEDLWQGGTMGVIANLDLGKVRDPFGTTDTLTGFFEFSGTNLDDVFINTTSTSGNTGIAARGNDGSDVFAGGNGYDVVFYTNETGGSGITVDLSASGSMLIDTFDGTNVTQINFNYDGTITDTFGNTDYVSSIDDIRGTALADTYVGSANDDRFAPFDGADNVDGGGGTDTVDYRRIDQYGATNGVTVDLSAGQASNDGFGNIDTLTSFERILGSVFADVLTGSSVNNDLYGYSGNDVLSGGDGNDYLSGGAGNDTLNSGSNADDGNAAYVSYFNDQFWQGGTMGVIANLDIGKVRDPFGDTDTLTGYFAAGGTMFDDVFLYPSAPNNGLDVRGYDGSDVFQGSAQWDVLRYDSDENFGGTAGITANLASGGSLTVNTFDGTNVTTFTFNYTGTIVDGFGKTDYVSGIDEIYGTSANDTVIGSAANDLFRGLDGADSFDGAGGDDEINYSNNTDFGAVVGVTVDLSANQAANDGFGNIDTLTNVEDVRGSDLADTITGDAADNRLIGRAGNDTLIGGDGNDVFRGGAGDDAISSGSVTADGNDGFLDYASEVKYEGGTMGIVANLDIGKVRGTFGDTDTLTGYFAMNGTQFVDVFQFNNGTGGGDGLDARGLAGNDVFAGGIGFDDIRYDEDAGEGGTSGIVIDFTNSGTLSGVSQFDGTTVTTFSFNYTGTATDGFGDTDYFAGIDRVRGTNQADTFTGSASEKQIFLPIGGNDVITGGSSDDEVDYRKDAQEGGSAGVSVNLSGTLNSGIAANSAIDGFGDTDTLTLINNIRGTESADTIIGNAFVNRLRGEGGNDILEGGGGDDLLEGGGGTDTFALTVGGGFDEIVDFTSGTDRFDLTDLLDTNFTVGNQATYIQTSQDGFGNTVLAVDQDGTAGGTNYVNVTQIDGMGAGQIIDIIFDTSSTTTVTS